MKKTTLFLACCIGLMLFASCKKDPVAPTISIFEGSEGEVCVTENAHVYSGDEITVGFMGQGEKLTKVVVVVSQDGTTLDSYSKNWENPVVEKIFAVVFWPLTAVLYSIHWIHNKM